MSCWNDKTMCKLQGWCKRTRARCCKRKQHKYRRQTGITCLPQPTQATFSCRIVRAALHIIHKRWKEGVGMHMDFELNYTCRMRSEIHIAWQDALLSPQHSPRWWYTKWERLSLLTGILIHEIMLMLHVYTNKRYWCLGNSQLVVSETKIVHLHPCIVNMLFQRNTEVHNVNTRQSRDLHVPCTRPSMYSKTIIFKGVLYGTK